MKNAKAPSIQDTSISWASWIYLLGMLLLACLTYSADVLDRTFLPRFGTAMLVLAVVSIFIFKEKDKVQWPTLTPVFYALLLFFFWNLQSLFWVDTFSEALLECQRVFLGLAVFWLTLFFLKNDSDFESRILKMALGLGMIAIVIAAYQILQIDGVDKLSLYEVKGISGHRNLFGALLFLMFGFSVLAGQKLSGKWIVASRVISVLLLLLLFLLQARSAWVGLFAALIFFGIFYFLNAKKIHLDWRIPFAFVMVFLLSCGWYSWQGGLSQFSERIDITQYLGSETAVERFRLWSKTFCTFQNHPIAGVGAGNWQTHFAACNVHGLYSVELHNVTYQRPHNDFLWVLSETGAIGFLLYLFFIFGILVKGIKTLKDTSKTNHLPGIIRLSILTGILVIAFFSFPKERIELLIWIYTLLALICHHFFYRKITKKADTWFGKGLLILIFAGSLFSMFTLWQRAKGEYEMNQIYFLKAHQKWPELLASCDLGESTFYTLDPNAIPINWYRGTAHFSLGQFDLARQDFEKALKIAPYSQHCWSDFGSCLEKLGEREKARESYLKALQISPMFDDPRLNLGILYYKEKDFQTAKNYFSSMQDTLRAQPYLQVVEDAFLQN